MQNQMQNHLHGSQASAARILLLLLLAATTLVNKLAKGMAVDHCYSDIGCFPLSEEFYHPRHRPFNVRPWHRRLINTQFLLFNRHHSDGYMLEPWDRHNLAGSRFDPLLETKIIIPGWLDSLDRALWVKRMKDSLLWLWQPVNIIVVHWRNFTPYTIATANTRVVGAELANLLRSIESELNYDRSYYHIIGHSLGAHIAGYAGDRLAGLGRITALDPARPFFQHMPKSVRLDRGDAKFVDAIHSDFTPENALFLLMSYGMSTPVGHLDFYPNGHSYLQPGCLRDTLLSIQNGIMRGLEHSSLSIAVLEATRYLTACDHQRSHEWFIESITNRQCTFVGVRCNEFEGLINGRCTCDDSPSACAIMGIHADQMYVHNLHEDVWPLGTRGSGRNRDPRNYGGRPSARPAPSAEPEVAASSFMTPPPHLRAQPQSHDASDDLLFLQQIVRPNLETTRDQIHEQLLHEAARLRKPPMPNPVLADEMYVGLDHLEEDTAFINYLRMNLMPAQQQHQSPLPRPPLTKRTPEPGPEADDAMKRRFDAADTNHYKDDVELIFSGNNAHPMNKHPKLMSDLDRDIENWYEDSSRWFLKTNNKPQYCVNQYQILIYLGPLRTTNGHKHLRANLLVSVIGSRGQLMNQRFIPRSTRLDSFTMQPFFVILEGSYSLGSILSVAVGWEARTDPDPVQATISFQSTLLENVQAALPAPPRMRPLFGETIKFDHSQGFEWRQPPPLPAKIEHRSDVASGSRSKPKTKKTQTPRISRRSLMVPEQAEKQEEKCVVENDATGQCSISQSDIMQEAASEEQANLMTDLLLAENERDANEEETKTNSQLADAEAEADALLEEINQLRASHHLAQPVLPRPALRPGRQVGPHQHQQVPYGWPLTKPAMPMTHDEFLLEHENLATAQLHNINNLHHLDNDGEDSIVINQIVVHPLQANYGHGLKPNKVFCPAHPGQRLERDQTIRLTPNILGRCPDHRHPIVRHHHG